MANFQEIRNRVEEYLIDLPSETGALVPNWVNRAVRVAEDRHNFRHMEAEVEYTTLEGDRELGPLPEQWKEFRALPWLHLGDGAAREIYWAADQSEALRLYSEDDPDDIGAPRHILQTDANFEVFPFPDGQSLWDDGEYRVRVPFWRRTAALTASTDENWFTANAEWYLVYAAVGEGMLFNREEQRAEIYITKAETEFQRLVRTDKRSRLDNRFTFAAYRDARATRFQPRSM